MVVEMKIIRPGTFETNSSSCHTITLKATKKQIDEFNEGKRWYFYNSSLGWNDPKSEALLNFDELFEVLNDAVKNTDIVERTQCSDYYSSHFSDFGVDVYDLPWGQDDEVVKKDYGRFKKYFIDNFDKDMFKFALDDEYDNPKYFSKVILRSFIYHIFDELGCPIMKIENLKNTYSSSCGKSQVYWLSDRKTDKLEFYSDGWADDQLIEVNIDIRDN